MYDPVQSMLNIQKSITYQIGVLIIKDSMVLGLRPDADELNGVVGTINYGETVHDAAVRIALENTGFIVIPHSEQVVGITQVFTATSHSILLNVAGSVGGGKLKPGWAWYNVDALEKFQEDFRVNLPIELLEKYVGFHRE